MTILYFFSPFLSLFLCDDIGRGQLNMQLNKSDDNDDHDGDGDDDEEEGGGLTADVASEQEFPSQSRNSECA